MNQYDREGREAREDDARRKITETSFFASAFALLATFTVAFGVR